MWTHFHMNRFYPNYIIASATEVSEKKKSLQSTVGRWRFYTKVFFFFTLIFFVINFFNLIL